MRLSIMTFSITTLSIKGLFTTHSMIDTQPNNTIPLYMSVKFYLSHCHYAECRYAGVVMLGVVVP
jgi:hypothetical protein